MKEGVILINTARGMLIDEKALIENLESGKVSFAALDTIEQENGLYYNDKKGQTLANHNFAILRSFPNVEISPHMAFYTNKAVSDQIECTVKSLYAFEHGEENPVEIK